MVTNELRNFVKDLFDVYTNSWNPTTETVKKNMYFRALSTLNIDFDKLLDYIANNWHDKFIPTPADVKDMALLCLKQVQAIQAKAIEFVLYDPILKGKNTIVAPANTSDQQLIKYLIKKTGVLDGWKIENKILCKN